ncbi:MAG: phosphatidylserine decarboxylase [Pirellulales bacterium]
MPSGLPDNIRSVQPGGGVCYRLELAWGRWRRWYLKHFRPSYVARMELLRRGDVTGAPHEVLDPRDLKYCANQCTAHWLPDDEPFRWREKLPFARWGLAELQIMGWPLLAATVALALAGGWWRWLAVVPGVVLVLVVWFFRDPPRRVPEEPGVYLAPADGTIAEITRLEHYDFLDGPAIRIGVFLSIFNVHINRAPRAGRVADMHYKPGQFLNAINPQSTILNEFMWIGFEDEEEPSRRFAVRQISGLFARRIVCNLRPGEAVSRGHKFGMIKLGSRTELIVPADVEVTVQPGDRIQAGRTIIARHK